MDSCPTMSINNFDIDMHHEPEDVQMSHDADLFDDDEDNDKVAGNQPPTTVPSTSVLRLNKRARDKVVRR